jgi:NAD(P)-dependent dehydrogenase (short-subunit alcohol dehydrogenase family)
VDLGLTGKVALAREGARVTICARTEAASTSAAHQAAEVDRLLGLGATRAGIGQGEVPWVVLADPEDNEFCVLTPR